MRVVFVYPDLSIGSRGKFYHGIAHISAMLKKHGHETSLIHLVSPLSESDYINLISSKSPELIAFSSTTNMFSYVRRYARITRANYPDIPIICGGIHPTLDPEDAIACEDIDMVCLGEGEEAMVELCDKIGRGEEIDQIQNIWIKMAGKVCKNPLRPVVENLDALPFADRDLFDYESLEDARLKRVVFMASRGCPYKCTFCSNHELKRIYPGRYVRFRSIDNVIAEAEEVVGRYRPEYAVFHDDILTLKKKWLAEFAQKWKKKIGLPFSCNSRVNLLDRETVMLLKEAGCFEVSMGIESGNPLIREQVLNRKMSNQEVINAFDLCHRYGIRTVSYNMVGLPFEDMRKILDTVKLNAEIKPTNLQVSIFYPFPHTKLYDVCVKNGFLSNRSVNSLFEDTVLEQPSITRRQIHFFFKNFARLVRLYSIFAYLPGFFSRILDIILVKLALIRDKEQKRTVN